MTWTRNTEGRNKRAWYTAVLDGFTAIVQHDGAWILYNKRSVSVLSGKAAGVATAKKRCEEAFTALTPCGRIVLRDTEYR